MPSDKVRKPRPMSVKDLDLNVDLHFEAGEGTNQPRRMQLRIDEYTFWLGARDIERLADLFTRAAAWIDDDEYVCAECGSIFLPDYRTRHRARFCSKVCNDTWHNAHKKELRRRAKIRKEREKDA